MLTRARVRTEQTQITHVAILEVVSLKLATGETAASVARWLATLEKDPALQGYWQGATCDASKRS